jgi:hypothetical protein
VLTRDLKGLYKTYNNNERLPEDQSFGAFLQHPRRFIDEQKHSDDLKEALIQIWELDSVSGALSTIWGGRPGDRPPVQIASDLTGGITFLNNDFRGIDFRNTNMEGVAFYGNCKVDEEKVPPLVTQQCK